MSAPKTHRAALRGRIIRRILWVLLGIVLVPVLLLGYFWATEWRPEPVEPVYVSPHPQKAVLPDTLTVLSWNIGYAGLGEDMDFFYDGGTSTRTTQERTQQNLDSIIAFIRQSDADFILLQEVDFDSKRSYRENQFRALQQQLPEYTGVFAYNYVSPFVPIPFSDPIGRVKSGLVTFSRYPVEKALRYQYPSRFPFPVSLFNLKRAMLTAEISLADGRIFYLNNTHNTAFDTGDMRMQEMAFMSGYLSGKPLSLTVGDWNSNPPGYVPGERELNDPHFRPIPVPAADFPAGFTFAADLATPSARYGYESYQKGRTATTLLDFALCGPAVQVLSVQTADLGFRFSDHNPVLLKVILKYQDTYE